jgi:hypothetical protein
VLKEEAERKKPCVRKQTDAAAQKKTHVQLTVSFWELKE